MVSVISQENPDNDATSDHISPDRPDVSQNSLDETLSFANPTPEDAEIDNALLGTTFDWYRIERLLGAGAMGRVYLAWHERLHRPCAIKVLHGRLARNHADRLEMFLTEARSAARLHHPNIITIHQLGESQGFHFIEMEYVQGSSLGKRIEDRDLTLAQRFLLLSEVCQALAVAHTAGIVHRDVKPDNVMVTEHLVAKLGDFGLARFYGKANANRRLGGTPRYMAPELFAGHPPSVATDMYALGTTLYAALSGAPPFDAPTLNDLIGQHFYNGVPEVDVPGGLHAEVNETIQLLLSKDPAYRPARADDVAKRLREWAGSLVELRTLVADAFKESAIEWTQTDMESFRFVVPIGEVRQQVVLADTIPGQHADDRLVSFWTPCAPLDAREYEFVLQLNGTLPYGAVCVRPYDGRPYFVMAHNHLRRSVTARDIRNAVLRLAHAADDVEHRITGHDIH